MVYYSLYIISRTGGLISHTVFSPIPIADSNLHMTLASSFHAMQGIAKQLSPVPSKGSYSLKNVSSDTFTLQARQCATGVKFLLLADPQTTQHQMEGVLDSIYELYADYVMKNPFYEVDQPIRCQLFDLHLDKLMKDPRIRGQSQSS
eukprot:Rmarinus@m.18034